MSRPPTEPGGNSEVRYALEPDCYGRHLRQNEAMGDMRKQVEALERHDIIHESKLGEIEKRLGEGAKKFTEIEQYTRPPLSRVLVSAMPVIMALAGVIWVVAKYPNETQVKALIEERSPYVQDRGRILQTVQAYETTMPSVLLKLGVLDTKLDIVIKKLEKDDNRRPRHER